MRNTEISAASALYELDKKIKLKIRLGDDKIKIIQDCISLYGDRLGIEEVREFATLKIDDFGDYELIQRIMRSKIVQEIDGRDNYILDPVTRTSVRITKERLKEVLHPKLDISDKVYTCKFSYNPFEYKQLYKDANGVWVYNQYRPPAWQADLFYKGIELEPEDELPEIYREFLIHLVAGDEKSFKYTLDWLANGIVRRNLCILTTIGTQGVGKGTLGEIMKALVGEENYSETGNRILAERFNSQIKNKRIVYCDEASVNSQKEEERLKALVNNALEVEAKGKDAEHITNYASFYFSSNSLDAIRLTAEDRRFSIVNLTNVKLINAFSVEQIKALTKPENIDKLARYLFFRDVDEHAMTYVFTSDRTEEIRSASLAEWEIFVLDRILPDNLGKVLEIEKVSDMIEEKFSSKMRPGKKGIQRLYTRYPKHFEVIRPTVDGRRVWAIKVPDTLPTSVLDTKEG